MSSLPPSPLAPPPVSHPLTLKVMRLFLPGMEVRLPEPVASLRPPPASDSGASASSSSLEGAAAMPPPPEGLYGMTGLLQLPVEFGTIYLGQYFSAYIVVSNYSGYDVENVRLMAELQTGSQRVQLR